MATAVDADTTRAIVVGIDHYPNLDRRAWLNGAVNDAVEAASWLREVGVPAASITLALQAREDRPAPEIPEGLSVTPVEDKGALDDLFLALRGQACTRLIVMLFGHGYHAPRQGPIFITADYALDRPTNLGVDALTAFLASLPIPQQFVIMDGCQNYTSEPTLRDTVVAQPLAGLAEPPRNPDVAGLLCTSASMGQKARENRGRGVFSRLLLEALRTVATPGGRWEGVVDVDFATGRRSVEVASLVHTGSDCGLPLCNAVLAETGQRQHPTAVPYTDRPIAPLLAVEPVDDAEVRVSIQPASARGQVRQLLLRDMLEFSRRPFLATPPGGPLVAHLAAGAQVEASAYLAPGSGLTPNPVSVQLTVSGGINPVELLLTQASLPAGGPAVPVSGGGGILLPGGHPQNFDDDAGEADGTEDWADGADEADWEDGADGADWASEESVDATVTVSGTDDDSFLMDVEDVFSIEGRGTVAHSPGRIQGRVPRPAWTGWSRKVRDLAWGTGPRVVVGVDCSMPSGWEPDEAREAGEGGEAGDSGEGGVLDVSAGHGTFVADIAGRPTSSVVLGFTKGGTARRLAGPLAGVRGTVIVRPMDPEEMVWLLTADQVTREPTLAVPPGPVTVEVELPWGRWQQAVTRGGGQTLVSLPLEVGEPPLRLRTGPPVPANPLVDVTGRATADSHRSGLFGRPARTPAEGARPGWTVFTVQRDGRSWSLPGLADGVVFDGRAIDGGMVADDEVTDGMAADGMAADGMAADGMAADDDGADDMVFDGGLADGMGVDGEVVDGEVVDGEVVDGEVVDGEVVDGMAADGMVFDGGLADGMAADVGGPVAQPRTWVPERVIDEVFHRHRIDVDPSAVRAAAERIRGADVEVATLLDSVAEVLAAMGMRPAEREQDRAGAVRRDGLLDERLAIAADDPSTLDLAWLAWAAARGAVPVLRWTLSLLADVGAMVEGTAVEPILRPWLDALAEVERRASPSSTWLVWADGEDLNDRLRELRTDQLTALAALSLGGRPSMAALGQILVQP